MKCKNCGALNPKENKYCSECGSKLTPTSKGFVYCGECGYKNRAKNSFCENCGSKLIQKNVVQKQSKRKNKKSFDSNKKLGAAEWLIKNRVLTFTAIVAVLAFVMILSNNRNSSTESNISGSNNPALAGFAGAKFTEIASKFTCACGTCNDTLTDCNCPTANREKQLIIDEIENSTPNSKIIRLVYNKYGLIKPEYKYLLSGGNSSNEFNNKSKKSKIALVSDRSFIISKFKCTCGQCNIEELAECNCTHPNGATEVKEFIDQQIAIQKFSVDQIIKNVNARYGGIKI